MSLGLVVPRVLAVHPPLASLNSSVNRPMLRDKHRAGHLVERVPSLLE